MSEILSQAEIEALLTELQTDPSADQPAAEAGFLGVSAPTDEPAAYGSTLSPAMAGRTIAYEVYDFRRPDKFAKDQLRTLQMMHETFARLSTSALSAYLRTPVHIELISLEQVPFEEYLLSINKSVFVIISMPPLTGQAVLELEFTLVFSMVDRMLGGTGKSFERASLTEIERPLVGQVLERLFSALKSAWENVVMVSPGVEGMETSSQFVQVAPPNDIVITVLFEVRVGAQRGAMSLCIPYLVLKPVTSKLSAQKWFQSGDRRASPAIRSMMSSHVNKVSVPCAVELGTTRLPVKEFLGLRPGDLLKLDQETTSDMALKVGNVAKFYGRPSVAGRKVVFGVAGRVEE